MGFLKNVEEIKVRIKPNEMHYGRPISAVGTRGAQAAAVGEALWQPRSSLLDQQISAAPWPEFRKLDNPVATIMVKLKQ